MKYFFYFFFLILLTTCEPIPLPIHMPTSPIFEMIGTVGNKPLNLAAGVNELELTTNVEPAPLQVVIHRGELHTKNCTSLCKGSLKLALRQNRSESKNISIGRKFYYNPVKDSLSVSAINTSVLKNENASKYTYIWTVNGKEVSKKEVLSFNIQPSSLGTVCLFVNHPNGNEASQCQIIDFNLLDSFPGLKVSIEPSINANKNGQLKAIVKGAGPFKFLWNSKISSDKDLLELDLKKESHHCVEVKDRFGNKASACIDLKPEAKVKSQVDFELKYDQPKIRDWAQYNSVELTYVDDQAIEWTTSGSIQPSSSSFEILTVEPFEANSLQQSTKKIKIVFDALFFNRNKSTLQIKAKGTMALALPN